MNLLYVILCCTGLTFILKYGSILSWLRNFLSKAAYFRELFKCSLCLGFWSGALIAGGLYLVEWRDEFYLLPFASSSISWILDSLIRIIQTKELLMDRRLSATRAPHPEE